MKFIFLFVFLIGTNIYAQNTYSVSVFDHDNNEPLIGATVYFSDLEKGEVTNSDGEVTISDIPNGIFTIEISYI